MDQPSLGASAGLAPTWLTAVVAGEVTASLSVVARWLLVVVERACHDEYHRSGADQLRSICWNQPAGCVRGRQREGHEADGVRKARAQLPSSPCMRSTAIDGGTTKPPTTSRGHRPAAEAIAFVGASRVEPTSGERLL